MTSILVHTSTTGDLTDAQIAEVALGYRVDELKAQFPGVTEFSVLVEVESGAHYRWIWSLHTLAFWLVTPQGDDQYTLVEDYEPLV